MVNTGIEVFYRSGWTEPVNTDGMVTLRCQQHFSPLAPAEHALTGLTGNSLLITGADVGDDAHTHFHLTATVFCNKRP